METRDKTELVLIILERHLQLLESGWSNNEAMDSTSEFMERKAFDVLNDEKVPVTRETLRIENVPIKKVLFEVCARMNAIRG